MSFQWVAVAIAAVFVIIGLMITIRWVRSIDWRAVWHEIPGYLYAAWEAERPLMVKCCVAIAFGLLGYALAVSVFGTRYLGEVPAAEGILLIISILAVAGGAIFLLASGADFVWHLLSGNVYEPGLDTVHEQKALGDADFAGEKRIQEALLGDAAFIEPKFED